MPDCVKIFQQYMKANFEEPVVLELGTFQVNAGQSTLHKDWVPHFKEWVGTDMQAGPDVNIVTDVHLLTQALDGKKFDAIISCSGFEHFKYPHIVAHEMMKALKPDGAVYVQTHWAFPTHNYPHDYWRMSPDALTALFNEEMGMEKLGADFQFDARVHAPSLPHCKDFPAHLNTNWVGKKVKATPRTFKPDLRTL